ncbi:MAG: hypothetical protein A2176_14155 [Spirochaetes bacterium RBG_13_51_14]|nr:MAG: hypothetical protein A2176_14155 [Spirochaetes bacterium RBG_13_51_14]
MMIRPVSIAVLLCMMASGGDAIAGDIRKVKSIQFRGLRLLTKYDVIRGVRLEAAADGIVIDVDSLERALSGNSLIKSFGIEESGGRLMVSVAERRPVLIAVVAGKDGSSLYELDEDHAIISKNDVHTDRVPVLYLVSLKLSADGATGRVRSLISLLERVKRKIAPLYREIAEIYLDETSIRVVARGRRTSFVLRPRDTDFIKLRYIIGYCDRTGECPEEINLSDNPVIVR